MNLLQQIIKKRALLPVPYIRLPLIDSVVPPLGMPVPTFARASSQTYYNGISWAIAIVNNPAFSATSGLLIEPAGINLFGGYSVPRADSYGSTITSGTLTKGKIYEVVSRATLDFGSVGTLVSGTANTEGAQYLITGTATLGSGDSAKVCTDKVGTKSYWSGSAFTTAFPGLVIDPSSDHNAIMTIVDGGVTLSGSVFAGLANGKVYEVDCTTCSDYSYIYLTPLTTGVTYSTSIVAGAITGTVQLYSTSPAAARTLSGTNYTLQRQQGQTQTGEGTSYIRLTAGSKVRFILPQVETGAIITSPIICNGSTTSRQPVQFSEDTTTQSGQSWTKVFQWTPLLTTGTQVLLESRVDANNYILLTHNGTAFVLEKKVAGNSSTVTQNHSLVASTVVKIKLRSNLNFSLTLCINSTIGGSTSDTAFALGSILTFGYRSTGVSGANGYMKNYRSYKGLMFDKNLKSI